ncbi:hypothetical protein KAR48_04535 [bacterium]|nr:hypothetical protein [bacterium]
MKELKKQNSNIECVWNNDLPLFNDQLMVDVIHKIKNGMGGIDGFAALLERDLEPEDPRRRLAEKVQDGVRKVNDVAVAVMLLARPAEFSMENVRIGIFIKQVLNNLIPIPELHQLDINIAECFNKNQISILADPRSLQRVFEYVLKSIINMRGQLISVEADLNDLEETRVIFSFSCHELMQAWPESIDLWLEQMHYVETRLAISVILKIMKAHDAKFIMKTTGDIHSYELTFKRIN